MRKLVSLSNYMITKYIGKNIFKCEMYGKQSKLMFQWEAMLTDIKMVVCHKCAKRESGKKHLHELEKMMEKHNAKR